MTSMSESNRIQHRLEGRPVFGVLSSNHNKSFEKCATTKSSAPGKENSNPYRVRRQSARECDSCTTKLLSRNLSETKSFKRKRYPKARCKSSIAENDACYTAVYASDNVDSKDASSNQLNSCDASNSRLKSVVACDVARMAFSKELNFDSFLAELQYSDCFPVSTETSENLLDVADYLIAIMAHEQTREEKACFKLNDFIHRQSQPLTTDMVITLADWMVEVHDQFGYQHETFHLAWSLLYAFFDKSIAIKRNEIQLYACAAILVACKQEELTVPDISELLYLTNNAYDQEQFLAAEQLLLESVDYNVHRPNPYFFLRRYYRVLDANNPLIKCMCCFLLDAGTHSHIVSLDRESKKAAAALWLARRILQNPSYVQWCEQPEVVHLYRLIQSDARLKEFYLSSDAALSKNLTQNLSLAANLKSYSQLKHVYDTTTTAEPSRDSGIFKSISQLREMEEQRCCLWPPLLQHITGYKEDDLIPLALRYHRIAIQLLAEVARGCRLADESVEEVPMEDENEQAIDLSFTDLGPPDSRPRPPSHPTRPPRCVSPGGHLLRRQLVSKYCKQCFLRVADVYPQYSFENLIPYFPEIQCPEDCHCFVCSNLVNPPRPYQSSKGNL